MREKMSVTIPEEIVAKLKALAEKERRTLSSMAEVIIAAGLEKQERKALEVS